MALTNVGRVRQLIGDTQVEEVFTDVEIQEYLDFYEEDVTATVEELRQVMLLKLSQEGTKDRIGDLWTDDSGQADDFRSALKLFDEQRSRLAAQKVIPRILNEGGGPRFCIGMFTEREDF
ncbi:hypothetical protein KAR91_78485 [Candidatus Pacearchaeota archaeon]|nr:hypothetical protein [Candidatus Pacearchaeota archaeon]